MKCFRAVAAFATACIILSACGRKPSENEIRNAFLKDHPEALVQSVEIGNGDNDGTEYFIDYIHPPDPDIKTSLWLVHWSGSFLSWGYSEDLNIRNTAEQGAAANP